MSRLRTPVLKNRENWLKSIGSEQLRVRANFDQQALLPPQYLDRLTLIVEIRRSLPIRSQESVCEFQFVGAWISTEVRAKGSSFETLSLKLIPLFDVPAHARDAVYFLPFIILPVILTGFVTLLDVRHVLLNTVVSLGNTAYDLWLPLQLAQNRASDYCRPA